jgi:hypothetical protein
MTTPGERYPPPSMSPRVHDLLAVYIQLNLLIRRLGDTRVEDGSRQRRDALLLKLFDALRMLERSGVWN